MGMKHSLLLLFILHVVAVKVFFVSVDNPSLPYKCSDQHVLAQLSAENSYSTDLLLKTSKLVDSCVSKTVLRGLSKPDTNTTIIVPISNTLNWQDVVAVLEILMGTIDEFPFAVTADKRAQLFAIYRTLQIYNLSCACRFWEALCADKQFRATTSDYITYLEMWLCVFCSTRMRVTDTLWLNLFSALNKRDSAWHCVMKYISLLVRPHRLSRWRVYKNASPLIRAILKLMEKGGNGLIIPHTPFLKGQALTGRFCEVVDIVRRVSDGVGLIISGHEAHALPRGELRCKFIQSKADMYVCVYVTEERLFVSSNLNRLLREAWTRDILIDMLPDCITDLYFNICSNSNSTWDWYSCTPITCILPILEAHPMANLWIRREYDPDSEIQELEEKLPSHVQLTTIYDSKEIPVNEKSTRTAGTHVKMVMGFDKCDTCERRKEPCFLLWYNFVKDNVRHASDILPSINVTSRLDNPYRLAWMRSIVRKASLKVFLINEAFGSDEDSSSSHDSSYYRRKRRRIYYFEKALA